jgi:hypothetical protein
LIALFKREFEYLLIIFVAVVFGVSNAYGYTKCKQDATQKMISEKWNNMGGNVMGYLGKEYIKSKLWG